MKRKDIQIGLLVKPSKNKKSRTRYWILDDYKGQVTEFCNSVCVRVVWYASKTNRFGNVSEHAELMKPVDIEPYE